MKRDTKGIERARSMRDWREHKGGLKPKPAPCLATPLGALLEDWLESQRDRGLRPSSIATRKGHLRRFLQWCEQFGVTKPEWLSRGLCRAWLRSIDESRTSKGAPFRESTKEGMIRAVNTFCEYLEVNRRIDANPLSGVAVRRCRGRRLPKILDEDQVRSILEAPDTRDPLGIRDRSMMEMAYGSGLRRQEVVGLELGDLSRDGEMVVVRRAKGGRERIVPISRAAREWVFVYLQRSRPLLEVVGKPSEGLYLTGYGEPFCAGAWGQRVKQYMKAAGIDCRGGPHLLRHACATHMLEHGADLRTIQTLLGHSRIDTIEVYTHVTPERLCQVHHRSHPRG
ncbi:tyrosine-type recombinase/integrase [Haloferula sp. A504]|uniref:tyrosine-type recombinase/integrase n=1 Tax=Haloferula sp. A504 TaxID=3373601 RepID=UPI0031BCBA62|nr:tyrosine-type recombinase/integrase [Verrucomicrobiaceae bacterium E54]